MSSLKGGGLLWDYMRKNSVMKAIQTLGLPLAKAHSNRSGIYCILNTNNHHCYVGKSKCLGDRKKQHFLDLRKDRHFNRYLQNAFNLYKSGFTFIVLEYVINCTELDEKEQYWMERLKPEYNMVLNVFEGFQKYSLRVDDILFIKVGENFKRPAWHAWVYGGARNPLLDAPRKAEIQKIQVL